MRLAGPAGPAAADVGGAARRVAHRGRVGPVDLLEHALRILTTSNSLGFPAPSPPGRRVTVPRRGWQDISGNAQ
jgi:hypothetical protein